MNDYLTRSRNLPKSFLFILPLLVFYEIGLVLYGTETKNTAGIIVKKPFEIFGDNAALVFNSLIIIISFCSIFYIEKKNHLSYRIFIPMFFESVVYGFAIGYVTLFFVHGYLPFDISNSYVQSFIKGIIISLGAGIYEEILFRMLLLSALYFIIIKALRINPIIGSFISILICAFIFSIMHYIGPSSDNFSISSFSFRLVAGIILSAIFVFRGLGIAVYTHAIYDILVIQKAYIIT
ncbi:CPBP family intramembrane glutamic endopeptidase [Candidatus Scalindua japonica]|uniref:CPBP family intramembrane glutamic endopeptidase n=1 Tax=Candidatus Scalindua japonica TaxID=1284222 RepID=UPI000BDE8C53|nr:CPBP family intramembrane glutamic endopeptidase [Candidatus Scalindua japonica]